MKNKLITATLFLTLMSGAQDGGYMTLPEIPVYRFPSVEADGLVWVSQSADGRIQKEPVKRFLTLENPAFAQAAAVASVSVLSTNELPEAWVVSFKVTLTNGVVQTNVACYPKAQELQIRQNMAAKRTRLSGYAAKMGVVVPRDLPANDVAAVSALAGRIRAYQRAQASNPAFARVAGAVVPSSIKGAAAILSRRDNVRIEPATRAEISTLIEQSAAESAAAKELSTNPSERRDPKWTEADRTANVVKISTFDDKLQTTSSTFVRRVATAPNTNCERRERLGDSVVAYFKDGRVTTNKIAKVRGAAVANPYMSKLAEPKPEAPGNNATQTGGAAAAGAVAGAAAAAAIGKRKK